jgi:hypothetical protein
MFIPHGAMQSAEATIALEKQPEEDCDSSEEEEAALPEQHVDNSFRFENAANMGEWQIFLAQSAGDELHSARRQGEKRLKIVLKKVMCVIKSCNSCRVLNSAGSYRMVNSLVIIINALSVINLNSPSTRRR